MPASPARGFRVGIDIGGTFTDIVLTGPQGGILTRKVPSTPGDYSHGICQGLGALLHTQGIAPSEVEIVVHATTVATNAVLEGKGARTGLITTAGFRDVLEFRRVRVPELYNLGYVKPKPLVPRQFRLEVSERLGADGAVRIPLDDASVHRAANRLRDAGIEAVAICLLHSYLDPTHEYRVRDIVCAVLGDAVFVTCSHDILPEMREYERTSTTVVNAFLGPVMRRYLGALRAGLAGIGVRGTLQVMTSGGGQMGIDAAIERPAYLVESGPAAGVIAAARIAARNALPDIITLDMGGTTAKAALVENAQPARTGEYEIGAGINLSSKLVKGAGYAVKLPFIDISEIGAGGGSELWFDKGGLLKVGPHSAGSEPGPVCYGRGGTRATLTDALLTLGFINQVHLVGGELKLQADAARAALAEQVAGPLGTTPLDAAHGALTVAVANMVRAVKSVSTYQGRDPRGYALLAFGGNGPIVAAAIARAVDETGDRTAALRCAQRLWIAGRRPRAGTRARHASRARGTRSSRDRRRLRGAASRRHLRLDSRRLRGCPHYHPPLRGSSLCRAGFRTHRAGGRCGSRRSHQCVPPVAFAHLRSYGRGRAGRAGQPASDRRRRGRSRAAQRSAARARSAGSDAKCLFRSRRTAAHSDPTPRRPPGPQCRGPGDRRGV